MTQKWEPGVMRSGGDPSPLTVGEIKAALANLDDDVEIMFGGNLQFYRWKWRDSTQKLLQMEPNETGD